MISKLCFQGQTIVSLFLVMSFGLWTVQAQDIKRITPRSGQVDPSKIKSGTVTPKGKAEDSGDISDESFGTVKGVLLLGGPDQVSVDNPPKISGVQIGDDELEVPDGVTGAIGAFIGGPLSLKSINDLSKAAILAYRKGGLPVVDIGFPEQNVSTGVLQLVVIVGKAGEITLEGNRYFDDEIYLRSFRTKPGDVLWEASIIDDLNFINRNPYHRVDMIYTPGEDFGDADIILTAEDRRPWAVYTGYENTGTPVIGEDRLFFGADWGNVFGTDQRVGYQYTTSTDFDSLQAHSATYTIPIWPLRHELRFLGAYVTSNSSTNPTVISSGKSDQLSATYAIPLPMIFGYTHEVEFGFDNKSTNNNLEFGGVNVFANTAEINQFSLGQRLRKQQSFGYQMFTQRIVWSPGEMSNHNSDASFGAIRAFSTSDYVYWQSEFTQMINLPCGFSFLFDAAGQLSNGNLLPSETMLLGGADSVRGFQQNTVFADQGVRMTMEVYTPPMALLGQLGELKGELATVKESARFFAFYDQAWAGNVDLLPGESSFLQLGGAGLGLDYRVNDEFSMRISHGWQVDQAGFADTINSRWNIYASMKY